MMSQQQYFGRSTEFEAERRRLSILERLFDSVTRDALTRLGVGEGWRCCEIGAGGGTITRWLAQAVGPTGRVVAVDLDTRFLTAIDQANVEVIKADILSDTSIGHSFDLVFTRFVLLHLSDPARAIRRMAELVRPSGWVCAIDGDLCNLCAVDPGHRSARLFDQIRQKEQVYEFDTYGINSRMGRSLPELFEEAGLVEVDNSAWTSVVRGGSLQAEFWYRTLEISGPRMVAAGVLSQQEHEADLSTHADPTFRFLDALYFQVSGRKPPI
jgi:SAM-dependent methyltransferase